MVNSLQRIKFCCHVAANSHLNTVHDPEMSDDAVNHPSQCGSAIQRASQQNRGRMEKRQVHRIFPEGMPSHHRLLQQREVSSMNDNEMNECIFEYTLIDSDTIPLFHIELRREN
jgi:hypothetical protein